MIWFLSMPSKPPIGIIFKGVSLFGIKNKCTHCHGEGVVKGEEVVEINIPAGVAEGMVVNVPGKGNAGRHNGVAGNIQVYIEEEPNDTFIRDGGTIGEASG